MAEDYGTDTASVHTSLEGLFRITKQNRRFAAIADAAQALLATLPTERVPLFKGLAKEGE